MDMIRKKNASSPAQMALDHLHHGVCLFDGDGKVLEMNRRFAEMYNPSVDMDKELRHYLADSASAGGFAGDPSQFAADLLAAMQDGRPVQNLHDFPDGRIMLITDTPVEGVGFLSTHEDVTDRVRAERRVRHMAKHDLLTELANRPAFEEELSTALAESTTRAQQFALFFIDLDRFKDVNDVFGHSIGDAFLKQVARRIHDVADGAFVARIGGDEFAIIQRGRQPQAAAALAADLQENAAGEIRIGDRVLSAGLSIGIAAFPEDGLDASVLTNRADAAMYRAKQDGRGTTHFFQLDMDETVRDRRALESDLHGVGGRGELVLHYQPQAATDGTVVGFEALVRWQHPTRGLLPPARFISLAEQNGAIIEIGAWVLREACREAASWQNQRRVSVNLSAAQLRHSDLPELVAKVLQETALSPHRLELELTETTLINDHAHALNVLAALKKLGVKIALDDFGTGFSSLAYLRSFAFDKLKIDRSFIADLWKNETAEAIVSGVINLAQALNIPVTAEGVETDEQLDYLIRETCNEVQGFRIGRPGPMDQHVPLLSTTSGSAVAFDRCP